MLGATGLVVAALTLASLAAQPRPSAPGAVARHVPAKNPPAPPRADHVEVLRDGGSLDLNLATIGDLELLPGIGPALARRIVEDRARGGAYRAVDDLTRVPGIGPGKLMRIRALVHIGNAGSYWSKKNTPDKTAPR